MSSAQRPPDPSFILRGHTNAVNDLSFHCNNDYLISGDADGELKVWKLARRRVEKSILAHPDATGGILRVQSLNENSILTQGRDGTVKEWDLEHSKDEPVHTLEYQSFSFCKMGVYQSGSTTLVALPHEEALGGQTINVWDIKNNQVVQKIAISDSNEKLGMCMHLDLFKAGNNSEDMIVSACFENGELIIWNLTSSSKMYSSILHSDPLLSMGWNNDHTRAISGSVGKNITVMDLDWNIHNNNNTINNNDNNMDINNNTIECKMKHSFDINHGGIANIQIRADHKIFATAGWDHRIRIFDYKKLVPLAILKTHTEAVNTLAFSPSSNLLASGGKDTRIALWAVY